MVLSIRVYRTDISPVGYSDSHVSLGHGVDESDIAYVEVHDIDTEEDDDNYNYAYEDDQAGTQHAHMVDLIYQDGEDGGANGELHPDGHACYLVILTTGKEDVCWATGMGAQAVSYCQGAESVREEPMTRGEIAELYETDITMKKEGTGTDTGRRKR